jgi:hypothetical protein
MAKELETREQHSGALVPIEKYSIMNESADNIRAIVADNLGNGTLSAFDLEQMRVPSGGSTLWERSSFDDPDADKDGIVHLKEIQGAPVYFRDLRAWWRVAFEERQGAGTPPDCQSQDNLHGAGDFGVGSVGNPTGLCSNCPKAQWKSDRKGGPGQDCSQIRALFIMPPEGLLPMQVRIPPTSVRECRKFFVELAGRGIPYWSVLIRMSLFKDKNAAGISYSKIRFTGQRVKDEMKERMKGIHEAMRAVLDTRTIDVSDVQPESAAPENK